MNTPGTHHTVPRSVAGKGILSQIVQGRHPLARSSNKLVSEPGMDPMGLIVFLGHGSKRGGLEDLKERLDPTKCQDCNLFRQGNE